MQVKTRVGDVFWYLAISLLVVLGIALWVVYVPEGHGVSEKWAAFAYFSLFLFGLLVRWYWRLRRSAKFWAVLSLLAVLHTIGYFLLLWHFEQWPALWYFLAMPCEAALMAVVIKFTLNALPSLGRIIKPLN